MTNRWIGVAPPRIGSGSVFIAIGVLLLAAGLLACIAGAVAFGVALASLGAGLIAVGFWSSLFSRLEARLMDIEAELKHRGSWSEIVDAVDTATPARTGTQPVPQFDAADNF